MKLYWFIESVGMCGSVLVIIALSCKSIRKLRVWNLVGSAVFVIYGLLLHSPSLILLNLFAAIVNARALKGGGR